MSGESYRALLQARSWSKRLREKGFTWDQIAEVLALTHEVSPLRLYRLAHGRTAADVVALVNDADPAGTAALRDSRLYDYEGWPQTGRRPPARLLATLAEIYQTSSPEPAVRRGHGLVRGRRSCPDRATRTSAISDTNQPTPPHRDSRVTTKTDADVTSAGRTAVDAAACMRLLRAIDAEEADVKRRELLFELALVFGGSQALGLLRILTPEEEERLAGVLRNTWRMDEATVRTFEKLAMHARRADDVSGPATLLPSSMDSERRSAGSSPASRWCPACATGCSIRMRNCHSWPATSTYDLRDYAAAEQSLRDGLRAALDLGDPTLIAYMHYWLGRVAADQNRTAAVFDHAFAFGAGPPDPRASCWPHCTKRCSRSPTPPRAMPRRVPARMRTRLRRQGRRRTTNRRSCTGSRRRWWNRGGPPCWSS